MVVHACNLSNWEPEATLWDPISKTKMRRNICRPFLKPCFSLNTILRLIQTDVAAGLFHVLAARLQLSFSHFLFYFSHCICFIYVSSHARVGTYMLWCTYGGQSTTCGSWFSPPTMFWGLHSGWDSVSDPLTCWATVSPAQHFCCHFHGNRHFVVFLVVCFCCPCVAVAVLTLVSRCACIGNLQYILEWVCCAC